MQVIALRGFLDRETGAERHRGEAFECTPERFKALNSTKWGALVRKAPKKDKERK